MRDDPKRKAKKKELQDNKKAKISATTKIQSKIQDEDNIRSIASAVINGVMNASQTTGDVNSVLGNSTVPSRVTMPQHGTHASRQSASTTSRRTYDHLGNIIGE